MFDSKINILGLVVRHGTFIEQPAHVAYLHKRLLDCSSPEQVSLRG